MNGDPRSEKDVTAIFQNINRRSYKCPACDQPFTQEPRLWVHAVEAHGYVPGALATAEVRKGFARDAILNAQRKLPPDSPSRQKSPTGISEDGQRKPPVSPGKRRNIPGVLLFQGTARKQMVLQESPLLLESTGLRSPLKRVTDGPSLPSRIETGSPSRHPVASTIAGDSTSGDQDGSAAGRRPSRRLFNQPSESPRTRKLIELKNGTGPVSSGRRQQNTTSKSTSRLAQPVSSEPSRKQSPRLLASPVNGGLQPSMILKPSRNIAGTPDTLAPSPDESVELTPGMSRQLETRPISHDQLVIEVKGIYAGLVMIEAKCIDVDEKQALIAKETDPTKKVPLRDDQWQSLVALHKQLLYEHHDFFLASQHPSASDNLKEFAKKYAMPARMWRHGIHAFLEILRHRLPDSLEHMLTFVYIAYSMMALLYETVDSFRETWIECLGDLGRYRMAIEDDDPRDREVWSGVSRFWYSKAADERPTVGRLYHHLAILAKPYTLEQLSFYIRALTCVTIFESARVSVMTMLSPIINGENAAPEGVATSVERMIIQAHGLLFMYPTKSLCDFDKIVIQLKEHALNDLIEQSGPKFRLLGVFLAASNIAALLEYGAQTTQGTHRSWIRRAFYRSRAHAIGTFLDEKQPVDSVRQDEASVSDFYTEHVTSEDLKMSKMMVMKASELAFMILEICLDHRHWKHQHVMPLVHVMLVFLWNISTLAGILQELQDTIPWTSLCGYLNHLLSTEANPAEAMWKSAFPITEEALHHPPPEDYILRGQVYTQDFFPDVWFINVKVDDEERMIERSSNDIHRRLRCLWLAARICTLKRWICYDENLRAFRPTSLADSDSGHPSQTSETAVAAKDTEMPDVSAADIPGDLEKDLQQPIIDLPTASFDEAVTSSPTIPTRTTSGVSDDTIFDSKTPTKSETFMTEDSTDRANPIPENAVDRSPAAELPKTDRVDHDPGPGDEIPSPAPNVTKKVIVMGSDSLPIPMTPCKASTSG